MVINARWRLLQDVLNVQFFTKTDVMSSLLKRYAFSDTGEQ